MNILEFGDAKLRLKDIDPLYYALHHSGWSIPRKRRFTFAFVTFDHAGLAGKIIDSGDFWDAMDWGVKQTLRGAPRRYFRGEKAFTSLLKIFDRHISPKRALGALVGSYDDASNEILTHWPLFGPCAAFKMADMAERVCNVRIDFSGVTLQQIVSNAMVAKGVAKAAASLGCRPDELLGRLYKHRWATLAGPSYDRPLNAQEFETILCYYSHDDDKNKHMPGMDVELIRGELSGWGKSAEELIRKLP